MKIVFSFFSPAQYDELMESDAMILFSVFDHDVLSRNDFGGEAFFPVRDTPGIQKTKQGSFHGLKPMELPLMFQEKPGKITVGQGKKTREIKY